MRPVPEQQSRPSPVLVCAVPEPGGEPRVVLADGSYESGGERVYWRRTPDAEVLRLPLDATVALRPVRRFPDQRPPQSGEERLRATSSADADGPLVLLVVPAGDRHTLALTALAHQLQEAGHRTLVAEDLPRPELLDLLAEQRVAAVVVSAHVPLAAVAARQLAVDVRAASPTTLVAVGGPGAPRAARGLDLISDDPAELLALLTAEHAVLTPRECDVLREVADGRTNSEIASALGLSPATV
jgi:hypothetical protein